MVLLSGVGVKPANPVIPRPKMSVMALNQTAPETSNGSEHRRRLLQAMASMAATKGLAAVTIADVVREAGVSKRTFYEHFESKDDCFLTLYRAVSMNALKTLRDSVSADRPWQQQLEQALQAYLTHMAASPELLRTLFIEIHHLGAAGERARRDVMDALAALMVETLRRGPAESVIDEGLALAAVGGINELILQAIEQGRVAELPAMTPVASEVVRRLARSPVV
jgi:AcrR family transcriptional regulator